MKRAMLTVAVMAALMLLGMFGWRSRATNGDQPLRAAASTTVKAPSGATSAPGGSSAAWDPYPTGNAPPSSFSLSSPRSTFQSQADRLREQYLELCQAHAALLTADALSAEIDRLDSAIAELVAARDVQAAGDILRDVLSKHPQTQAAATARQMLDASQATAAQEGAALEAGEAPVSESAVLQAADYFDAPPASPPSLDASSFAIEPPGRQPDGDSSAPNPVVEEIREN